MHKLDEVLNTVLKLLEDRNWHRIEEIAEKTGVTKDKIVRAVTFLSELEFVEVRGEEVRIKELGLEFLEL
jgi:DNA-binding IclR family transcriptional regulator